MKPVHLRFMVNLICTMRRKAGMKMPTKTAICMHLGVSRQALWRAMKCRRPTRRYSVLELNAPMAASCGDANE